MLTGSAGLIENQIKNWVRQSVCVVDKENGRCKKLVLRHLNVDRKPQGDVHTCNLSGDPALEGTEVADKVIMEIADRSQSDANDQNAGVQTYAIYAYYTTNTQYVPRKIFRVAAEEEMDRDAGPSEPPTERGIAQQLMRHNEVVSKNSLVSMGYIIQTFQKEIQQQREQNKHFLQQQIEMTLLVQDVLNDASKRRIEEKQSELATSMLEGTFEHLKIALPILINRLAGKGVMPEKMDRELYLISSFLENLTGEQQEFLKGSLKPTQLAVLGEILKLYEDRKGKFIGEKKPGEEGKANGTASGEGRASSGANKFLTLFESRRDLVHTEKANQTEDEWSKRIEERASKMRGHLQSVADLNKPDTDEKKP